MNKYCHCLKQKLRAPERWVWCDFVALMVYYTELIMWAITAEQVVFKYLTWQKYYCPGQWRCQLAWPSPIQRLSVAEPVSLDERHQSQRKWHTSKWGPHFSNYIASDFQGKVGLRIQQGNAAWHAVSQSNSFKCFSEQYFTHDNRLLQTLGSHPQLSLR